MATIKLISKTGTVKKLLDYICQEKKAALISGFNCSVKNAAAEMQATKQLHRKTGGRQAFHMVQSWKPGEITPEIAYKIGKRLVEECKQLTGFEVVLSTHTDRKHIHNHFAINSVNAETGEKLHTSKADLAAIKELSDALCREYGLSICEPGKDRTCPVSYNQGAYRLHEKAMAAEAESYIHNIALAVIEAQQATSKDAFIQQLREKNIEVEWAENRKHLVFTDLNRKAAGEKKCKVRESRLEKLYPGLECSKEALLQVFEQNRKVREEPELVPAAATAPEIGSLVAEMSAELQQLLRGVTWQARAEHREKI